MSQSNLSGPLYVTDNLVVGGSVTITGGMAWSGGTIAVADTIDAAGGTISVADVTATGVVSAGNFTSLGTAGIHNAVTVHSLTSEGAVSGTNITGTNLNMIGTAGVHGAMEVHSLVNEGALTALGTTGLQATQVASLVDLGALTALGTTGLAAVTASGALNVLGTAGVHSTLTAHELVSDGNVTATGGTLTVGTNKLAFGTNTPAAGAWIVGDVVFNNSSTAASGGTAGWICTSAGSQGTWKAFGTIYA
jgi:hypothetical protein